MAKRKPPVVRVAPIKGLPGPAVLAAKLRELNGNQAAVGRAYGVTRQAVTKCVAKHPELQEAAKDAREGMLDNAESALYRAIIGGEAWAVCFFLKTQGKSRGYVERTEVEAVARNRLVIEEEIVGGD